MTLNLPVLVFERLCRADLTGVHSHIAAGGAAYYFDRAEDVPPQSSGTQLCWKQYGMPDSNWVRWFCREEEYQEVFRLTEELLPPAADAPPPYRRAVRRYGTDAIMLYPKKRLLRRLSDHMLRRAFLRRLAEQHPGAEIVFSAAEHPRLEQRINRLRPLPPLPRVTVRRRGAWRLRVAVLWQLAMKIAGAVLMAWRPPRFAALLYYPVGWRCYATDIGLAPDSVRNNGFIVDGVNVRAGDLLLCAETPLAPEYRARLRNSGYAHADLTSRWPLLTGIWSGAYLPELFRLGLAWLVSDPELIQDALFMTTEHARWRSFLKRFRTDSYVVYNHTDESHITRNCLLRQAGVRTVFYTHSAHNDYVFMAEPEQSRPYHQFYAGYYYSDFIVYNAPIENLYRAHPNTIDRYHRFGCLWSELIADSGKKRQDRHAHFRQVAGNISGKRLLAAFDTTFGCDVWNLGCGCISPGYLAKFNRALLRLLDDDPSLALLYQEKTRRGEWLCVPADADDLLDSYAQLARHPRAVMVSEYNRQHPGQALATEDLINLADLSVSIPFTSTTNEALGAGKRAIFFDATGEFRDTFYNQFPELVANGEAELRRLVSRWLDSSEEGFMCWLTSVVVPKMDAFGDGRAITRFRHLLRAGAVMGKKGGA